MQFINTAGMSHDQWLKLRQTYVGPSEFGAILGLSKWKTPLDVFLQKKGDQVIEDNIRMKFGRDSEDLIANWFMEDTQLKVRKENKIRVHPQYAFIGTNIDRMIESTNGIGPGTLQIKTASDRAVQSWDGEVPPDYYAQIQGEMAVTGWNYGYFAILIIGFAGVQELKVLRFDRDQAFIDAMIPRIVSFWENNVMTNTPPDPVNEEDIHRLYPVSSDRVIDAVPETVEVYKSLINVKAHLAVLEKEKEQLEQQLKLTMGEAHRLVFNGNDLVVWKSSAPGEKFDAKRFQADHPEQYKQYLTETAAVRRFLVKSINKTKEAL